MQKLCGFLNFIGKCIVPGRAFTRRLYAVTAKKNEDDEQKRAVHHHVYLKSETRHDLKMWLEFLNNDSIFARPFNYTPGIKGATEINM